MRESPMTMTHSEVDTYTAVLGLLHNTPGLYGAQLAKIAGKLSSEMHAVQYNIISSETININELPKEDRSRLAQNALTMSAELADVQALIRQVQERLLAIQDHLASPD